MDKYLQIVNYENEYKQENFKDFEYVNGIKVNFPDKDEIPFIEKETYEAYLKLQKFLKDNNIPCSLNSAGRTIKAQELTQQEMFEIYLKDFEKEHPKEEAEMLAKQKLAEMVAKPGHSEHHTGLAIDLSPKMIGKNPVTKYFANEYNKKHLTENYAFLAEVAPKFGFIVRYTKDNASSTGVKRPEPWHLRYVGVEHAQEIARRMQKDPSYSLEQYVELLRQFEEKINALRGQSLAQ